MMSILRRMWLAFDMYVLSPREDALHYRRAVKDRAFAAKFPSVPVTALERLGELADQCDDCVVFGDAGASRWLLERGATVTHLDRDPGNAFALEFGLSLDAASRLTVLMVERGHEAGQSEFRRLGLEKVRDCSLVYVGDGSRKMVSALTKIAHKPRVIVVPEGDRRAAQLALAPLTQAGWRSEGIWGMSAAGHDSESCVAFLTH